MHIAFRTLKFSLATFWDGCVLTSRNLIVTKLENKTEGSRKKGYPTGLIQWRKPPQLPVCKTQLRLLTGHFWIIIHRVAISEATWWHTSLHMKPPIQICLPPKVGKVTTWEWAFSVLVPELWNSFLRVIYLSPFVIVFCQRVDFSVRPGICSLIFIGPLPVHVFTCFVLFINGNVALKVLNK